MYLKHVSGGYETNFDGIPRLAGMLGDKKKVFEEIERTHYLNANSLPRRDLSS